MISGRGGMGNSKHRTSGVSGHNADKQIVCRDVNKLNERVKKPRERYASVAEAFKAVRSTKKGKRIGL